jgi:hypothetical protein
MITGGNYAIRPLFEEVNNQPVSRGWEIVRLLAEDDGTIYAKKIGTVDTPIMGVSSLTLVQFILACHGDKVASMVEEECRHVTGPSSDEEWDAPRHAVES